MGQEVFCPSNQLDGQHVEVSAVHFLVMAYLFIRHMIPHFYIYQLVDFS
uniref:Uncharacterized protein n=1 Tax=Arundo donax TaxID=35708 RepID=A0A0A9DD24_ARUDO